MLQRKALLSAFTALIGLLFLPSPALSETRALSLDEAVQRAIVQSPDVQAAEASARLSEIQSKLSLSPFLPEIAVETGSLQEIPKDPNDSGTYYYGIGRINLYNGGVDSLARKALLLDKDRAEASVALSRQKVSRDVTRRYAELLFFDESLKLKREALELNRKQMQLAKRKASGGITSSADVLEFEFRENELNTEISLLVHERALSSRELSTSMGSEPRNDLDVIGPLTPELAKFVVQPEGSAAFLEQLNVLNPKVEAEIAELRNRAAASVWLPKLNFEIRYGNMEFADPEVLGSPAWRFDLRLTLPIFTGLETVYARQATASLVREKEAQLRRSRLTANNQIQDREEKLQVLQNLIRMQKENIARAERYYKATLAEYLRGVKNSPDLSGATERLFNARLRELALVKDVVLARIGLLEVTSIDIP